MNIERNDTPVESVPLSASSVMLIMKNQSIEVALLSDPTLGEPIVYLRASSAADGLQRSQTAPVSAITPNTDESISIEFADGSSCRIARKTQNEQIGNRADAVRSGVTGTRRRVRRWEAWFGLTD